MADVWKETYTPRRKGLLVPPARRNHMPGFPVLPTLPQTLVPMEVWCVRVCSFTFVFHSREQLDACLHYYDRKTRPSSLIPAHELPSYGGDTGECQRWFDRLPMYLLEEPKRKKVVSALRAAAGQWENDRG